MFINVAFDSGGIKGLSYIGALKYFEERGYKIHKTVGCSVGAIFASLAISGMKTKEMTEIINKISTNDLKEFNGFIDSFKQKGINNIKGLERKLRIVLSRKGIRTFQDLKYGDDYLLKVIVTDNRTKKMVVIPDDLGKYGLSKDEFSVAKAVAMSCSIPLFYSEYRIGNHRFVDGGATCSFPIHLLNNCNETGNKVMVIGLKIVNNQIKKMDKFFSSGLEIAKRKIYKVVNNDNDCNRLNRVNIIEINVSGISSIQFSNGLKEREELYKIGYQAVKRYFQ